MRKKTKEIIIINVNKIHNKSFEFSNIYKQNYIIDVWNYKTKCSVFTHLNM